MTKIHEVNRRIIREVKEYPTSENIKNFLQEILIFELQHFDDKTLESRTTHFRHEYEKLIDAALQTLEE
jgi:hypothetical protein